MNLATSNVGRAYRTIPRRAERMFPDRLKSGTEILRLSIPYGSQERKATSRPKAWPSLRATQPPARTRHPMPQRLLPRQEPPRRAAVLRWSQKLIELRKFCHDLPNPLKSSSRASHSLFCSQLVRDGFSADPQKLSLGGEKQCTQQWGKTWTSQPSLRLASESDG